MNVLGDTGLLWNSLYTFHQSLGHLAEHTSIDYYVFNFYHLEREDIQLYFYVYY